MLNETIAIAHEVKQPLTAVISNGNYCLRQLAQPSPNLNEVRAAIQEIIDAGNRAILIISRIGAVVSRQCQERTALEINEILTGAVDLLRPELDRSGTNLTMELARNLPSLLGDPVQLQQAFVNVMMNSIEAMRSIPGQNRAIFVETGRSPKGIFIEIRDLGPGILATRSERIFEPLFTTRTDGLGLGLPISRSIAEAHGGSLCVIPATDGAVFQFILPISAEISYR
jgi:C4-dicarboxylate-specific signal transduction histidine kinase